MKRAVFILWLIFHIGGFVATSYGVLREAFSTTAIETGPFEPGVFEKGVVDDGLTRFQNFLVSVGGKLWLLPREKVLTIEDRKRNAALAIGRVFLIVLSIVFDLWHKWLTCERGNPHIHHEQGSIHKKTRKLERTSKNT